MDILKEKWEEILYIVKVEHELSEISFKTWLKPLQLLQFFLLTFHSYLDVLILSRFLIIPL